MFIHEQKRTFYEDTLFNFFALLFSPTLVASTLFDDDIATNLKTETEKFSWLAYDQGVELGSLSLRQIKNGKGWGLQAGVADDFCLFTCDSIFDRQSEKVIDSKISYLAVDRVWQTSNGWGFSDFSIGVGVAQGEFTKNCERLAEPNIGLFNSVRETCDINDDTVLAVPIRASINVGKLVGIGLSAHALITTEDSFAGIGITVDFGKFN